ncbi:MAG: ATP-binding protein [Candidatus Peribacteraceae bacterium]|jgi:predicted HTH transcriptional regulator
MSDNPVDIINELRKLSAETEYVEFKMNNPTPEVIGECISALANSACLHQMGEAYLIFGIDDQTHAVKGTTFDHKITKGKGGEDLECWLDGMLNQGVEFRIEEISHPDGRLVAFYIQPASAGPVKFKGKAYIRIGSHNKNLASYPEKEAIIWDRKTPFEDKIAKEKVTESEIIELLNTDAYFRLTGIARPKDQKGIIEKMLQEGFVTKRKGNLHITNLGAILLAENLGAFPKLQNRAMRVITYDGISNLNAMRDVGGSKGYAVTFENLIQYIEGQLPAREEIIGGIRKVFRVYPASCIREFVANALSHQDFSIAGSVPTVEIFENRIEISNPGSALIEPDRFIDHPPKSRNEKLSDKLRRMHICEKRGSGVDRAFEDIEVAQLPPPKIESNNDCVRVTIYSHKPLTQLTKEEQCRACYFHSCIQHVVHSSAMTNDSLCKRLAIEKKNKATASRIIGETSERKWIKPFDPDSKSRKHAKYIPYWA